MQNYALYHKDLGTTIVDLPSLFSALEAYGVSYEIIKNDDTNSWDITLLDDSSTLSLKALTYESPN